MSAEYGRKLNYDEALTIALADQPGWTEARILSLEDYLVRRYGEVYPAQRERLDAELLEIQYTVENLIAFGQRHKLMADFDLQTEALKVYCRKNNIEINNNE